MYHFTSKKKWNNITRIGKLTPGTIIESFRKGYNPQCFTEKTKLVCRAKRYTVGFPEPYHKGWVKYGLWDELFRLIECEVLLKLKIPENTKGFVREHAFCSPKAMKEKYGEDIYFLAYRRKIDVRDPRIQESLINYLNSVVPLREYEENYIVPEIWIPEEISLSNIEEIPFQR